MQAPQAPPFWDTPSAKRDRAGKGRICKKSPGYLTSTDDIERFLKYLSKNREEWQVKQASEAIQLYLFYENRKKITHSLATLEGSAQWKAVAEEMRKIIRLKHLSILPLLLENGHDIRTIQELLGHTDLRTMIYTHVASTNKLGIKSPLD